jgi:hypothetical protein
MIAAFISSIKASCSACKPEEGVGGWAFYGTAVEGKAWYAISHKIRLNLGCSNLV